jgi:hypothetical protein
MTEKGIPFSDQMVRALLSGAKTQTRRTERKYRVGDVLYIREAWRPVLAERPAYELRADGETRRLRAWPEEIMGEWARVHDRTERWRPPMFMFRALARPERWLVVREREERLQDITTEDAWAEGSWTRFPHSVVQDGAHEWRWLARDAPPTVVECFRLAWDEIYAARPQHQWSANPTVYAYTLEPIPQPAPPLKTPEMTA